MIEIPRAWRRASQPDAIQFMIMADGDERLIHLKKSQNQALYKFIVEHATQRDAASNGDSN